MFTKTMKSTIRSSRSSDAQISLDKVVAYLRSLHLDNVVECLDKVVALPRPKNSRSMLKKFKNPSVRSNRIDCSGYLALASSTSNLSESTNRPSSAHRSRGRETGNTRHTCDLLLDCQKRYRRCRRRRRRRCGRCRRCRRAIFGQG